MTKSGVRHELLHVSLLLVLPSFVVPCFSLMAWLKRSLLFRHLLLIVHAPQQNRGRSPLRLALPQFAVLCGWPCGPLPLFARRPELVIFRSSTASECKWSLRFVCVLLTVTARHERQQRRTGAIRVHFRTNDNLVDGRSDVPLRVAMAK